MALEPFLTLRDLKSFNRDLWGDEFAHCAARVTVGWGNVEYRLFLLLQAIDSKKVSKWVELLFKPRAIEPKKKIIRAEIAAAVKTSYPRFISLLENQLTKLQSIQSRRNLISHGLWLAGTSDQSFMVQPLSLERGTLKLEQAVEVNLEYLSGLIQDMDFLEQGLSSLGAEMLAHQFLNERGLR